MQFVGEVHVTSASVAPCAPAGSFTATGTASGTWLAEVVAFK